VHDKTIQCESKKSPLRFSDIFFQNGWVAHLLDVPIFARLQFFIQLSPTVMKLCHIKHNHPTNFYISLERLLLNLLTEQMTSQLTSCHIQHVS